MRWRMFPCNDMRPMTWKSFPCDDIGKEREGEGEKQREGAGGGGVACINARRGVAKILRTWNTQLLVSEKVATCEAEAGCSGS
jgi:hypothetical protein